MLLKCCLQYVSKFEKLTSGHRTGKGQFSFQSQRWAMPKNIQTTIQLHSFHMLVRLCSKSFKLCFSSLQLCLALRSPMDCSMPVFLVHHQLPELAQTHVQLSWWCHPTISSSFVPFSSCLQSFPASGSFSSESVLCIRWPKYWSFSFTISPSNEYSELISFRIDWLFSLQSRDSQESSPTPQFKSINSSALSFVYSTTLTSIHDHWKNHSFD